MEVSIPELEHHGDLHTCSSAVIIREGKILLGLRHYTPDKWKTISVWTTPGGRCEAGESVGDGLRRETSEETGITSLTVRRFLGEVSGMAELDTLWVFLCETTEEPTLMEPEKFSDWKWFPLAELPENFINPSLAQLLVDTI
ncbi:MAG: hypothetical protein A2942_02055 [Candidatus Lloydbacteria bacterium RIFCSPLOWO2_01_FULL_50_20]|uniref:Nudix hydrolase domain-containing protein n=1 Tax=Candidatus Lloydbacteria bacterium RIFCSPLOWO2_01_FULL_50_20 TaxID=1798665 RepID=A0A1G2DJ96_9BACT|nr:MAG: hypothetical protein A3C13_03365 [Candidatus Lloydbacteria bacterium RIFCSPHIGHO2_02_FULL_50_11]OGZ13735.1 MAG: hypothetical protein A2942_02055 [Candidatus Lloydbacteria bacterium RIFCSPLOWO2_01_FULL_50_20]